MSKNLGILQNIDNFRVVGTCTDLVTILLNGIYVKNTPVFNFFVKEVQRIRLLLQNYSQTTQGHQLGQQDVVSHPKDRRLYLER